MRQRWYDENPTLSMAVSLLNNLPLLHQEMTAKYMLRFLEDHHLYEETEMIQPEKVMFLFPAFKRPSLDRTAWKLLEVIKMMPTGVQIEVALTMINYMYLLESDCLPNEGTFGEEQLEAAYLATHPPGMIS